MNVNLEDLEFVKETRLTIRGSRRRTTVPKTIVEKLNLTNDDKIRWLLFKDDKIIIMRAGER
jgi:bifunctional DNA-binding transcriptional regulator/antitoxin component of YhaV-PrlF toxin-antitoxin module